MTRPTKELEDLVAPAKLEDVLGYLKQRGEVAEYVIGQINTTVRPSPGAEIGWLMKQECKPRSNPRPYIKKRKNDDD